PPEHATGPPYVCRRFQPCVRVGYSPSAAALPGGPPHRPLTVRSVQPGVPFGSASPPQPAARDFSAASRPSSPRAPPGGWHSSAGRLLSDTPGTGCPAHRDSLCLEGRTSGCRGKGSRTLSRPALALHPILSCFRNLGRRASLNKCHIQVRT